MRTSSGSSFSRRLIAGLLGLAAVLASAAPVKFDLPAQPAGAALLAFSKQAGAEVLFAFDQVNSVRTNALTGTHEPAEAMIRLLADTGLAASRSASGKWIVAVAAIPAKAPAPPAAPVTPAATRAEAVKPVALPAPSAVEEGTVRMKAYQVTGSHIRRLEGEGPQPIAAYAKEEIDALMKNNKPAEVKQE